MSVMHLFNYALIQSGVFLTSEKNVYQKAIKMYQPVKKTLQNKTVFSAGKLIVSGLLSGPFRYSSMDRKWHQPIAKWDRKGKVDLRIAVLSLSGCSCAKVAPSWPGTRSAQSDIAGSKGAFLIYIIQLTLIVDTIDLCGGDWHNC